MHTVIWVLGMLALGVFGMIAIFVVTTALLKISYFWYHGSFEETKLESWDEEQKRRRASLEGCSLCRECGNYTLVTSIGYCKTCMTIKKHEQ